MSEPTIRAASGAKDDAPRRPQAAASIPAAASAGSLGLVLAIFAESMLSPAGMHFVTPSLPLMQAEFVKSASADILVPMAVTLPGLMLALCAPFMGALGDRLGVRPLLIWSMAAYIVLGMIPYWLPSLPAIVGARFLFGIAESALAVCGPPLIAAAFVAGRRRAVIGVRIAFIGLASMVLAFCGGWAATYGWRAAYLLYAFAVLPLILVLVFVPRSISVAAERQEGRQPRQLWGVYGLSLVYGTGIAAVFVYAAFLQKELGIHTPKLAGSLSALSSFTTIAVALAFPFIVRRASVRMLVVASFALMAAGCLTLSAAGDVAGVTAGLALAATGMGLFTPTSTEMVLQYSLPQRRGRAVGLALMSIYLGNFLVPFAMTTVTRNGFTVGDGYLWLSGLYVVAALVGVVLARTLFAEPRPQSGASATPGLVASNQEI